MTSLKLSSTATRTRIIAPDADKALLQGERFLGQDLHNVSRGAPGAQFIRHDAHGAVNVVEKGAVAGAEIV
jgi:hypothetical protein